MLEHSPSLILGIETSCDETSAAVVADGRWVRSNIVSSQTDLHARYGGVVPEIAARAHIEQVRPIVEAAVHDAGIHYTDLTAIAVTDGPGLIGSLLVGVTFAKTLAYLHALPLVAVDHIHAHAISAGLAATEGVSIWPAVALVVSGGHTSLYHVHDELHVELLGQTHDDAAGEAFDKVAAILELGYPGGPQIDRLARSGNPKAIAFPRTWLKDERLDFSYSGLKTAVLYHVHGPGRKYGSTEHISPAARADIAASFQAALVEPLVVKTVAAAKRVGVTNITIGGGVAANSALRAELQAAAQRAGLRLYLTPGQFCTDNAAMIAALGYHRFKAGMLAGLALEPRGGLVRETRAPRS